MTLRELTTEERDWLRHPLVRRATSRHPDLDPADVLEELYGELCRLDSMFPGATLGEILAGAADVNPSSRKQEIEQLYASGLTCTQIAERLGVSRETVSRWRAGGPKTPKPVHSYKWYQLAERVNRDGIERVARETGIGRDYLNQCVRKYRKVNP